MFPLLSLVVTVNYGSSQSFIITPNTGYVISSVWINGTYFTDQLENNTFTFTNIVSEHAILVDFEPAHSPLILPASVPAPPIILEPKLWEMISVMDTV